MKKKSQKRGFFHETSNFYFLALKLGKRLLSNMRKWFSKGFVMKAIFGFPNLEKKNNFTNFGYGKTSFWRSIWEYRHNKSKFFAVFFFLNKFLLFSPFWNRPEKKGQKTRWQRSQEMVVWHEKIIFQLNHLSFSLFRCC